MFTTLPGRRLMDMLIFDVRLQQLHDYFPAVLR